MVRKEVVAPREPSRMEAFYEAVLEELLDILPPRQCRGCPADGNTCRLPHDDCDEALIEHAKRRVDSRKTAR